LAAEQTARRRATSSTSRPNKPLVETQFVHRCAQLFANPCLKLVLAQCRHGTPPHVVDVAGKLPTSTPSDVLLSTRASNRKAAIGDALAIKQARAFLDEER